MSRDAAAVSRVDVSALTVHASTRSSATTKVATARRACPTSRSYRSGNTARAGRHQYRGNLAEQPTCAGAAPSRPRTSDFRRSARHDAVEFCSQRLPKPAAAPESRAGTSERRGRGVYGSCGTSSRRPPRRRRGGGFCLVGELRRPPDEDGGDFSASGSLVRDR